MNPCANGATCLDLVNGYKCACAPGFTSKDCSVKIISPCEPSPCLNDGQCTEKANDFECTCKPNYFGSLCEHKSKGSRLVDSAKVYISSPNQLPSTLESRPSAERLNSEQLILISIISLIVPLSALLIYVFLRYIRRSGPLRSNNNGLPCKSIEEVEVMRQNEANNLLNNSSTLNNNSGHHQINSSKLANTAAGANVIVNSLNKASSVYSLNKAKSTMKLNNLNNQLNNNENIYSQHPANNYAAQLRQQHSIYSTLNNQNRHSMYGMIGGYNKLSTFTPADAKLVQQPLYATMKKPGNNQNNQFSSQLNGQQFNVQQPNSQLQNQKSIYESVQYGQIKPAQAGDYPSKNVVYGMLPKRDKY